jgi:hypothetical protein
MIAWMKKNMMKGATQTSQTIKKTIKIMKDKRTRKVRIYTINTYREEETQGRGFH